MNIGVLTIHDCENYGAVLQASATLEFLKQLGYKAELIDYATPDLKDANRLIKFPTSKRAIIDDIRNVVQLDKMINRRKRFNSYKNEFYSISQKQINSIKDFHSIKDDYDCFITGSDQTFNLHLRGDSKYRIPYFLNFTDKTKVSLSSSMGDSIGLITEHEREIIKEYLCKYTSISVRDVPSKIFLETLLNRRIQLLSDPTICVNRSFWDSKVSKNEDFEYILFYSVVSAPWVVDTIESFSKVLKLPVIAPHPTNKYELGTNFVRKSESGPYEFLNLIYNAKLVLTTSFHATVFSILFKKPFYAFRIGEGNRIGSLLDSVEMRNYLIENNQDIESITIPQIDFSNIDFIFEEERSIAQSFIRKALGVKYSADAPEGQK